MVDERLAHPVGFFLDDLARAALGAHEQDLVVGSGHFFDHIDHLVERRKRVLEVNDVNLVAGTEDVLGHLRVPVTGLVTKVCTCLEQVAHVDMCHG